MKYKLIFLFLKISCVYCTTNYVVAQTQQGFPYSFIHKISQTIPIYEVPLTKGEKRELTYSNRVVSKDWEKDFKEIAKVKRVKRRAKLYRATIEIPDAQNIGLNFNYCGLSENSRLFFYDDAKDLVIGPITKHNLAQTQGHADWPTFNPYLTISRFLSNKITVELYEPAREKSTLKLWKVYANHKPYPEAIRHKLTDSIPEFMVFGKEELLHRLSKVRGEHRKWLFTNGVHKDVDITLDSHGVWHNLPNGDRVWRIKLVSFMAENLTFSGKATLPKGAKLFSYNPLKTMIQDAYHATKSRLYALGSAPRSVCIIEYYEPITVKNQGSISITSIGHEITRESVELSEQLYLNEK